MSANLLNPRSKEYFDRTREEHEGISLPELLAKTEKREDEAWEDARGGLRELGVLLEENADGPFFMGSVGKFFISHQPIGRWKKNRKGRVKD